MHDYRVRQHRLGHYTVQRKGVGEWMTMNIFKSVDRTVDYLLKKKGHDIKDQNLRDQVLAAIQDGNNVLEPVEEVTEEMDAVTDEVTDEVTDQVEVIAD